MKQVQVHSPNPQWPQDFEAEAAQIALALGDNVAHIHHIGSTSIPNIYAKPVIDMLVEVTDIDQVDACDGAMVALGYTAMGEYGLPGRRYFRKDNDEGVRTHHVHTFQLGSSEVVRHLAFRDFMRANPDCAQQYSDLKRALAAQHPNDIDGYMDGKDEFVKAMEQRAIEELATEKRAIEKRALS
ncbi:MAG: GrpB family protein [Nodosilinea sp.]